MLSLKVTIVDGYLDEPAALGVPPYVSPMIRAAAGLLRYKKHNVKYYTIDTVRTKSLWGSLSDSGLLIVFGGLATPGRYVGGSPITPTELNTILSLNQEPEKILMGPIIRGYSLRGGKNAQLLKLPGEVIQMNDVFSLADRFGVDRSADRYELLNTIYPLGADVIKQHPRYPDVIVEFDVSSGCDRRDGHCSFCTESLFYGAFQSRSLEGIAAELQALKEAGAHAIRFGRSSNILAFGYDRAKDRPDPAAVESLFSTTRDILSPSVLHVDNANPLFITRHPKDSTRIMESIARYDTPGDVLSFGVETFDDRVRQINRLGGNAEEIMFAIELANSVSTRRVDGVPKLLPGINLLYGLPGQSSANMKTDREYLDKILDSGSLVRRVNIRRVIVFEGTPISHMKQSKIDRKTYEHHKSKIRNDFDLPMIKRVFPVGAIIRGVLPEYSRGRMIFGRPLATYPILMASPVHFGSRTDLVVIGHGSRSLTAIPLGSNLNMMSLDALKEIPGIGRKLATTIVLKRPFGTWQDLFRVIGEEATEAIRRARMTLGEEK